MKEIGMDATTSQMLRALESLDRPRIETLFHQTIGQRQPIEAVESLIVPALEQLGQGWISGDIALSQVYMASRICEELVQRVLPLEGLERLSHPAQAIVVLSDYHTLGKRIVLSVMRASGFAVIDYGRMDVDELVQRVIDDDIRILLISVLMLPAALKIKAVREALDARGSRVRIAVGGAPFLFDPALWREVGADAMGESAADALSIVRGWMEELE
ncbi:MAG: cobalamin-dependent protein [Candidatus Thiodiazotropha sp.]|jgi:methanogenic corrinoid protein MtbC1